MRIEYTSKVLKQLKKIPEREKYKIIRKIKLLSENPYLGKSLQGEYGGLLSVRAWPYRIIYLVNSKKKMITIFSVAHRQSVYN